jgi:hypothetical protein
MTLVVVILCIVCLFLLNDADEKSNSVHKTNDFEL